MGAPAPQGIRETIIWRLPLDPPLLPPANEVWGKVIFSQACVKNSVHGGRSASLHAGIPPPPARRPPLDQAPLPSPGKETPWARQTPRHSACWEIRSTSRWYASYWNASYCLLTIDIPEKYKSLDKRRNIMNVSFVTKNICMLQKGAASD